MLTQRMRLLTLLVILLALTMASCQAGNPNAPVFEIKSYKPEDQINVRIIDRTALVEINSQSGIGQAAVSLKSGLMPAKLILRLYLKGLENLRFIYGGTAVSISISSTGNQEVRQNVSKNSAAPEPLSVNNPFWMPLQIVATGGADKRIPLQSGYFEIEAPQDFMQNGGQAFTVQWIDFYR